MAFKHSTTADENVHLETASRQQLFKKKTLVTAVIIVYNMAMYTPLSVDYSYAVLFISRKTV